MSNLLDVFDGNEIFVYVADEYTDESEEGVEEVFEDVNEGETVILENNQVTEINSVEDDGGQINYEVDKEKGLVTITEEPTGDVIINYDHNAIGVDWDRIDFRRNIDPDIPDTARDVYDGIRLEGTKPQRAEGINLTIEAEFQGFSRGLWSYENSSGLLVKIEIQPHGEYDEVELKQWGEESYYLNWSPENAQFSPPDEGEVTVTLEGSFDRREYALPSVDDVENWMDEE